MHLGNPRRLRNRAFFGSWYLPVLATAAAVLMVSGCGGDEGSLPPEVAPIEAILDGEIRVEEVQATSAVVRVTTTVPVVCSVVYGSDTTYGQISTDLDMGGQAHADHEAPLRGLEPDSVVHYRLQGTGPDGTVYMSADLTFQTPAGDSGADSGGTNLAASAEGAAVLEVSSTFGDSAAWAGENAIDGDPATEWSSQGDGNEAFIVVGLAGESDITAVGIWSRTMGTSAEITRFQVLTDRGDVLGPFEVPDATTIHLFEVAAKANWLRYEVLESSGGNTGIVELVAIGAEAD